ncbi:MAG: putative sporulation-specific glycosylase YdhD [Microgenomates bacterium OLB23]|nr:MAG: putative sporulation-specific glycosylase YdhD [Microgenomates bacterium OLB23]
MALIVGTVAAYLYFSPLPKEEPPSQTTTVSQEPARNITASSLPEHFEALYGSIFVPYWKVGDITEPILPQTIAHKNVRNLIYFGVTPAENGSLISSEPGFAGISRFIESTHDIKAQRLLAVRMMNEGTNEAILDDKTFQSSLVSETLGLVRQYGFDGVLIDLEHSVLPTKNTVTAISEFIAFFAERTHSDKKVFTVALYGDTFYRQRPYDVTKIASVSDEIIIMAYDFHKSYGEPGPNFPLFRGEEYSYDFATMIEDFRKVVPAEKITVLFGLFGYDWSVDDQNRPAKAAAPLSLSKIEATLVKTCVAPRCTRARSATASELNLIYTDDSGQKTFCMVRR